MGPCKVNFSVEVREGKSSQIFQSELPVCEIELRLRHRYQLRVPSNEGMLILIEDVTSAECCRSVSVPLIFPISVWRQVSLPTLFQEFRFDASVVASLRAKVAAKMEAITERSGFSKVELVANVWVLKEEVMTKEEVYRIVADLEKYF